jgi:phosphatidylinositol kinase/protein kinase (PI-3  family)
MLTITILIILILFNVGVWSGDEVAAEAKRSLIRQVWRGRLKGVQRNVEVWQALLSVRTLVLPMHEDTHTWLKFASLCRKSGRVKWVITRPITDTSVGMTCVL